MPAVAELVSAYPTAGGMYFVAKNVVPQEHAAIWSWIIGWCNLLGQTAGVASVAYTVSQMVLASVSMNSTFNPVTGTYAYSPQVAIMPIVLVLWVTNLATQDLFAGCSSLDPHSHRGGHNFLSSHRDIA
jgi:amino acid transporter